MEPFLPLGAGLILVIGPLQGLASLTVCGRS
jgi:hypothetical protein